MPLFEYECKGCGNIEEKVLPLKKYDLIIYCSICGVQMNKTFTKLTTVWKGKDRKWGTSLYRKHDKEETVKKPKLPEYIPKNLKG